MNEKQPKCNRVIDLDSNTLCGKPAAVRFGKVLLCAQCLDEFEHLEPVSEDALIRVVIDDLDPDKEKP